MLSVSVPLWAADEGPVCAVPRPAVPDPALEGWGSEAFADRAQKELKHLLTSLEDAEEEVPELNGAFALLPVLKVVAQNPSVTVRRGTEAGIANQKGAFKAALASLRAQFLPGVALHYKVKTVGVTLPATQKAGVAETVHLVHIDGSTATGRREINATWQASWLIDAAGRPKQLRRLICQAWEDAETRSNRPWFSDQTSAVLAAVPEASAQLTGGNGYYRLRLQATLPFFKFGHHGIAIADVNGDGLEDVYLCQPGGLPNRLLIHQPDHTVSEAGAEWGVGFLDSSQCALLADFDNDGDPDMALATAGPLVILENTGSRFVVRLRLPPVLNCYGLTASDYDLDGDIDLYATRYFPSYGEGGELAVPMPHFDANNGGPNFLIRNDGPIPGDTWCKFSDATAGTGLDANNHRFSYASVWDDFNNDGLPDLYVANDFGRNNLYLQSRGADGRPQFRDVTDAAGLSEGAFGMSASSGDFNRDGWPDIHLGAMFSSAGSRITSQSRFRPELAKDVRDRFRRLARGNTLFLNKGKPDGQFADVSESAGITLGRWSWAALFSDIDNDTWPDLLVANGFVTGEIPDDL